MRKIYNKETILAAGAGSVLGFTLTLKSIRLLQRVTFNRDTLLAAGVGGSCWSRRCPRIHHYFSIVKATAVASK